MAGMIDWLPVIFTGLVVFGVAVLLDVDVSVSYVLAFVFILPFVPLHKMLLDKREREDFNSIKSKRGDGE